MQYRFKLAFSLILILVFSAHTFADFQPPQNIYGTYVCDSTHIEWDAPLGSGVMGYNLYWRITESEPWVLLRGGLPQSVTRISFPEVTYLCYGITAIYELGESVPAIICSYEEIPISMVAPIGLKLVRRETSFEISWAAGDFGCGAPQAYEVWRKQDDGLWEMIGSVNPLITSYIDNDLENAYYCYRINIVSDQESAFSSEICRAMLLTGIEGPLSSKYPTTLTLQQNYPNPFNPSTQIRFHLPGSGQISLSVFDALGREVSALAEGFYPAGHHTLAFDAAGISAGIYYYRLEADGYQLIRKMTLTK